MKTTAQKLMVIAGVAFLSLSLNAQNTKSVKLTYYKNQMSDMVVDRVNLAGNFLTEELYELKALVRYRPSEIDEERYAIENDVNFTSTMEALKKDIKYSPSGIKDLDPEKTDNMESLNNILSELEKIVKYKPGNSFEDQSHENNFDEIIEELSKVVKYTPSAII